MLAGLRDTLGHQSPGSHASASAGLSVPLHHEASGPIMGTTACHAVLPVHGRSRDFAALTSPPPSTRLAKVDVAAHESEGLLPVSNFY